MGIPRAHLFAGKTLLVVLLPLAFGVVFPRSVWAQAKLENPQPHSAQSGIGVISGWACKAARIDIEIDGAKNQAAYGTSRADTSSACGGDLNNGFGLLFNWNLLPPGPHTVSAWADGNKFAEVNFTVASFGSEFLTGASGEFTLDNFPQEGQQVTLLWQESQQNFVIKGANGSGGGISGGGRQRLENPRPGSFQSGIGVISGWACEATQIDIEIDGAKTQAAYGTSREDTHSLCEDANNGFGLLFNWNRLSNGPHQVRALADGQEFADLTVTVTTFGTEFLQDVGKSERLENFPLSGTDIIVAWQQSLQNFAIARVDAVGPRLNAMDAAGDSMTKAFNAQSAPICPTDDQEFLNWSTSDTHGSDFCGAGGDDVFSQAERLECRKGAHIISADPNDAKSGAQMLKSFVSQANKIKTFLSAQPEPRYVTVLLGHNDVCAGTIDKFQSSCDKGDDQDPNNYCRTTPAAFEREFRKGLEILITVPHLKVGVASLVRVSQLCNYDHKQSCIFGGSSPSCGELWQSTGIGGPVFGLDHGICGSLTKDCSDQRIIDAYETAKTYHNILADVTAAYAKVAEGEASPVVTVGGETVGGATKAAGVLVDFSEAPWVYKFRSREISCCDCYHPSKTGQNTAARILFDGFTCSEEERCCADTGDALADGLCSTEDTSGTFHPGLF
ncbi:MAG TPA: SGNH/GDSL hydrolase family protein [Candidatus Binatia bacterium]|nr:SGNH/GDSL hydrolase family protein [Candidatus Binatia bacterium]